MSSHTPVANRPYTVIWRGRITPLVGQHGVLSSHARPELAKRRALKWRDQLAPMFGAYQPWFFYQVIDARDGSVVAAIF